MILVTMSWISPADAKARAARESFMLLFSLWQKDRFGVASVAQKAPCRMCKRIKRVIIYRDKTKKTKYLNIQSQRRASTLAKAITNVPIHTNGSAQMQHCAVVDRGNSARLGRFHNTCTSAKTHLEAQQPIISTKLSAMSSVNYVYEITVSIFVKIQLFPSIVLQRKHFSGERFILKQWKRCHSFT